MDSFSLFSTLMSQLPPGLAGGISLAVTVGLIASGAAAQIAALCGFEGVARVSNILHAGLQVLAGNYGKATNVAQPHASAGGPPPPGAAAP